ncbi:MAG TPA: hypothetical protein VHU40_10375 [Polyangia bacterium]|nr:hypothetical protein [Polyangia bacterium]
MVIGGVACASTSGVTVNVPPEVRESVAVSTSAEPQLLVAGPTRLLHANYDRRAGVVFLRAPQQGSEFTSCRSGVPVGWDGQSDLDVGAGESICVKASRKVNLSWHARALGAEIPEGTQHASLK